MSLVYITQHNESIFDVEKVLPNELTHHEHYQSKYHKKLLEKGHRHHVIEAPNGHKLLTSSKKCKHATMGESQTAVRYPNDFLKKNGGVKWRRIIEHKCPPPRDIPPVPRYVCPKNFGEEKNQHRVNFVKLNKKMLAFRSPLHSVDSVHGDRHCLRPFEISDKNFGKVPRYLKMNKNMLAKVRAHCVQEEQLALARGASAVDKPQLLDSLIQENSLGMNMVKQGFRYITRAELRKLLAGLKSHFAEVLKIFQAQTLHTDSMAKKLLKSKLEKEMRQLEWDIFLLECNPTIFISKK